MPMAEQDNISCSSRDVQPRPHGLILIDKPPGPTSFDCIRFLRRTCNLPPKWKTGHLGTLDPFASGVMVIALGQAVRYAGYGLHSDKMYRARLWLGDETDTLDPTGKVTISKPVPEGWKNNLEKISQEFTGKTEQVPPAFSAKQVNGERSYTAARKGRILELKPATIEIYSLQFTGTDENWIDFVCHVSGGTYIRSLARDIALRLGTVGHLLGLERIRTGPFPIEESIPFSAFEAGRAHVLTHHLRPINQILDHLPQVVIRTGMEEKLINGIALGPGDIESGFPVSAEEEKIFRIMDSNSNFRALGKFREGSSKIIPFKPWLVY
jgi:tRNA pseudouridine55 synthase